MQESLNQTNVDEALAGLLGGVVASVDARATRQLAKYISIPPSSTPAVGAIGETWIATNVALGKDLLSEYVSQVQTVLQEAPVGIRAETLVGELVERGKVARSRAKVIAKDQTLKLNADVNKAKQQQAGVNRYRWSASSDERVRSHHADLDGQVFSWDEPPMGGGTTPDESGHPGSGILCRCVAVPIVD